VQLPIVAYTYGCIPPARKIPDPQNRLVGGLEVEPHSPYSPISFPSFKTILLVLLDGQGMLSETLDRERAPESMAPNLRVRGGRRTGDQQQPLSGTAP
jgi:hypothetical protein